MYLLTRGAMTRPEAYIPRIVDAQVKRYLSIFGAVEISGTKWCGKTWTALHHGASVVYVDENLQIAQDDPSIMLLGDQPHVIDEWQLVPAIWDCVRHAADQERGLRGAWILTGSSTPFAKGAKSPHPSHSGAGRIGRIRMSPMTLAESGDSVCTVSLTNLFKGVFAPGQMPKETENLVEICCRGGWPEALDLASPDAQIIAREYLRLIFDESGPLHGKKSDVLRKVATSIARNLGQAATQKTIISDIYGSDSAGRSAITPETLSTYLSFLKSVYLLEEVRGWEPPHRSRKRIAAKPKRYLADPSLAVALLGMSTQALMRDWQTFGLIFENLCMRDLIVYGRSLEFATEDPVKYYRDDSGLEVDAILELADGRWAAFEFKVGESKVPQAVANLKRLKAKLCENPKAKTRPPEFMAVITGVSEFAWEVEEGIYTIPIRALCP